MKRNIFARILIILLIFLTAAMPCCAEDIQTQDSIRPGTSTGSATDSPLLIHGEIDGVRFENCILVDYPFSKEEQKYSIPDGVIGIQASAFSESIHLRELVIPESCRYIGIGDTIPYSSWFFDPNFCSGSITHFMVRQDHPYFSSQDGVLFTKDGSVLLKYSDARQDKQYMIPDGVSVIGEAAFQFSPLETVFLPQTVQAICSEAFYESALQTLNLPEGLLLIGSRAFYNCKLKQVAFPSTLLQIDAQAFEGCFLEAVKFPEQLKSIGAFAFFGNPVAAETQIELPASLEDIGDDIFRFGVSSEEYWTPVFFVHKDSFGLRWAEQNDYPFIVIE